MIERIATTKKTKEIINNHAFTFQKRFGQNFLVDTHVIDKIISGARISDDDAVIEIGPGIGSLTQLLAEHAKKVIAIEIDKKLIPILEETLAPYDNIQLVNEDVLKVDINRIVEKENDGKPVKVVANLPYYITTPIIMKLFEENVPIESVTVMVQKEVAHRMNAVPGTKDYGTLSLAVQYYADTELVANVPANCFIPRPKVASAVIKLTKKTDRDTAPEDEKLMFALIKGAFAQRRKTVINSMANSGIVDASKEKLLAALEEAGIDPKRRGETFTLKEFIRLSDCLREIM